MPALRFPEALQETVRICVNQHRHRGSILHRKTQFLRDVRHRSTPFALGSFRRAQCQRYGSDILVSKFPQQISDAFLKGFTSHNVYPITCARIYSSVDEVI